MEIPAILAALRTNRTEFASAFMRAQAGIEPANRVDFEAVDPGAGNDHTAFAGGLTFAKHKGFLPQLLQLIASSNRETGDIALHLLDGLAQKGQAGLEAVTNRPAGFTQPLKKAIGLINGSRWTGKVMIGANPKGTGILIGANLLLTGWHVVQDLFDPVIQNGKITGYKPKTYTAPDDCSLSVIFDDAIGFYGGYQPPQQIKAHQQWHVAHSPCHPDELNDNIPHPKIALDGYWDYAIIRLATPCGFERRWVNLDKRAVVPGPNADIMVFQHPAGLGLQMDERQIKDLQPSDPAVPGIRFLHTVNSLNGSSGGPCFDKDFYLIGIHQGKWPDKIDDSDINRGVPITGIMNHLQDRMPVLPVPEPQDCPMFKTDEKELVIGCDHFVSLVWRTAISKHTSILRVIGQPKSGKTFHINVLRTLLPDADHLKIMISFEDITRSGIMDLIKIICSLAGVPVPVIDNQQGFSSSQAAWIKSEVLPKLIAALDTARQGRMVWISFTEMNNNDLLDKGASDFLFLFYEEVLNQPWLRFVLDGITADLTPRARGRAEPYIVRQPTQDDVGNCLRRLFSDIGSEAGTMAVPGLAKYLYDDYEQRNVTRQATALAELSEAAKRLVISFQNSYQ